MIQYFFSKLFIIPEILRGIFFTKYNRMKFKLCGVTFGKDFNVNSHLRLFKKNGAVIRIGNNVSITSGDNTNPLSRNQRGCIIAERDCSIINIGNNVGISSSCIWAKQSIEIGNYVNIGADSVLMDSDAHSMDWRIRMRGGSEDTSSAKCGSIVIEDHAFIGTRCIILKGVKIGARSIIAAGSVVTKSIPPDSIAGGNPCKVIKKIKNIDLE